MERTIDMSDNGETSRTHEPYKYEKLFMRTARKTLEELAKEGILDFKTEYSLRANLFRALDQLKTSVKRHRGSFRFSLRAN